MSADTMRVVTHEKHSQRLGNFVTIINCYTCFFHTARSGSGAATAYKCLISPGKQESQCAALDENPK